MKLSTELALIEDIKNWTGSQLIGDDCAVLSLAGPVLASADSLVENVHFSLSTTSLFDLGYKSGAVNLSDIAAMSGKPRHILVSLVLPPYVTRKHLKDFYTGLVACTNKYDTKIAGGNLASGEQFSINITVLAEAHTKGIAARSAAQEGDVIFASGNFGASQAGLALLNQKLDKTKIDTTDFAYCLDRHTKPEPQLELAWQLMDICDDHLAMMDTSDGLADALFQMSRASQVSFEIDLQTIPIHSLTKQSAALLGFDALDWAFYGGEDYELLGCVSKQDWHKIEQSITGALSKMGEVKKSGEAAVKLIQTGNSQWDDCLNMDKIFDHFENRQI